MTHANTPPQALLKFQSNYSQHLRAPNQIPPPQNIPEPANAVYQTLVFNNICGFIHKCFPVAKSILPTNDWQSLIRSFWRDWTCHTPYFSQIPFEFVHYLQKFQANLILPAWLPDLVDYEWQELNIELMDGERLLNEDPTDSNTLLVKLNPCATLLTYAWPVHKISPAWQPLSPEPCVLVVFRDSTDRVQFMEINPLTGVLLEIIKEGPIQPDLALMTLHNQFPDIPIKTIIDFGQPLLADLLQKQVLL